MTVIVKNTWNTLGSIQITVVVLLLLAADCVIGYLCLNGNNGVFHPLNEVGLYRWAQTYGRHHFALTGWLFALLLLLAVLAVNTFVCTTNRVVVLLRSRLRFHNRVRFLFRFSPHVMHYALILMLLGYLGSYLLSDVYPTEILTPGSVIRIPGSSVRIELQSLNTDYYKGERIKSFENRAIRATATLLLSDGSNTHPTAISFNRPVRYKGYGIYLKDFSPKSRKSMSPRIYINLSIRKDPGIYCYIAGMGLFSLGLAMYAYQWIFLKGRGE